MWSDINDFWWYDTSAIKSDFFFGIWEIETNKQMYVWKQFEKFHVNKRKKKQQHEMAEKDYIWKQNASKWNVCDWHYSTWELIPQIV